MRIIGGRLAGRSFESRSFKGRPTTNLAKQALFNILMNRYDFEALSVLDLYAGTGAIGFEFLSRGSKATLVEADKRHALELKRNAKALGVDESEILNLKAELYIKKAKKQFDIIFADPPYDSPAIQMIPRQIASANLLTDNGVLIIEHRQRTIMETPADETRQYGDTIFSFYNAPITCPSHS